MSTEKCFYDRPDCEDKLSRAHVISAGRVRSVVDEVVTDFNRPVQFVNVDEAVDLGYVDLTQVVAVDVIHRSVIQR